EGRSVRITPDGGYAIGGRTMDGVRPRAWLLVTDEDGTPILDRSLGSDTTYGNDACLAPGGGYVVVGHQRWTEHGGQLNQRVYVTRVNAGGGSAWTYLYGADEYNWGHAVEQTADSGFIVVAYSASVPGWIWQLKLNPDGSDAWTRVHTVGEWSPVPYWVRQVEDGGYVIVGSTGLGGGGDFLLLRTGPTGDSLWARRYGNPGTDDAAYGACRALDGGYALAGYAGDNALVVRTDSLGDTLWTREFAGPSRLVPNAICPTSDSGFLVAGQVGTGASSDMYFLRLAADGGTLWTKRLGGGSADIAYAVAETPDHAYIAAGCTASFGAGGNDLWLVKLAWEAGVEEKAEGGLPRLKDEGGRMNSTVTRGVELERFDGRILDITGREAMDRRPLRPGVYFLTPQGSGIQGFEGSRVTKVVVTR
ncbi:hypothetical protein JXD38_06860, partial [candidate division WOR-3 bacterium]|nr:hypothetical protein [candidate division WOR-3 bacterium]